MKFKTASLIMFSIISVFTLNGQASKNLNPVGDWNYVASDAPEGYQSGLFSVSQSENNYSVTFSVTGSDYKVPGDKAKFENNILTFYILLDGNQIDFILKMESGTKMTGKAMYSEGEVSMLLTKIEKK